MSRIKNQQAATHTTPVNTSAASPSPVNNKEKTWLRMPKLPVPLLFFLLVWAWAWLWWGDVLWVAHERSFFAADSLLMHHVAGRPFGMLWLAGRALLSLCAWPWLGAAVMALLLTGIACCLKYSFVRRGCRTSANTIIETLCYLLPTLWITVLSFEGYDAYFKSEPGHIFGLPAMALVVCLLQAVFVWSFRHRRKPARQTCAPRVTVPYPALTFVIVIAGSMLFENLCRPWVRPTAKMERLYDAKDWDGIRQVAVDNATLSCRPMSAYYAIALVKRDLLLKHLFDIRFEYDEIPLHDYNGKLMNETPYYVIEADMHAGLLQFAYHKAVEDLTMDGPTIHNLKAMVQITAMRHEDRLCRKYLDILDRTLGTADFTAKWRGYLADSKAMERDPDVIRIRQLEPLRDAFENAYTDPAFLGYNLMLFEGRSQQALKNSIAVCLYTKLMPPFMERVHYLGAKGIMQNPIVADAMLILAMKRPEILSELPQLRFNKQRFKRFATQMEAVGATGNTENRMPYAKQMWENAQGYYPYYYYFGNLRATRKDAAEKYGYGKGEGVN